MLQGYGECFRKQYYFDIFLQNEKKNTSKYINELEIVHSKL